MGFECSKCGACCRFVGAVAEMQAYDRGDGACRHLTPGNLCAIYETRPEICRVDAQRPPVITEAHWNATQHDACERLHLHVYGQPMRTP